jgi:glycosyltransferase involved in cell wall biosynthesis
MTDTLDVALLMGRFGTGGVERVACHLANGFTRRGIRTEIVVAHASGPAIQLVDRNIPTTALAMTDFLGRGAALLTAVPALARFLRARRPAVLLSPGNHTHLSAALAHGLVGGRTKLVIKITNPLLKERHGFLARVYRKSFYRWILRRAESILLLSPHGLAQIEEICPQALGKTRVVHNPYIEDRNRDIRQPRSSPDVSDKVPMILAVGRLTRQKNYKMLLRAAARLPNRHWRLVFLGEGPQRSELEALAEQLGLSSCVQFPGFVNNPDPYYQDAQVLALSSDYEDLPAVLLEALASGCPVVATECSDGVVSIMQRARHGELVARGDEPGFSAALHRVLAMGGERRPFVDAMNYTISKGVDDHLQTIHPLCRHRSGTPPEISTPQPAH